MRRATAVLFALAWAAVAASFPADGEALFRECEFKAAAHSFERALTKEPGNARLHFSARQVICANGRGVESAVGTPERA